MQPPPPAVARAFGVRSEVVPRLLAGGQGQTWRCEGVVLKPVGCAAETEWVCEVLAAWPVEARVRVPQPVAALDGTWVYRGWAAHRWLQGRNASMPREADTVRAASEAFHAVTAELARPSFIDVRSDAWSYGDRVAWQGADPDGSEPIRRLVEEALTAYEPVRSPSQVIHGDIGGNVLTTPGVPPAVIDWPPYFRPAAFALAVAAIDALCWSGAAVRLLDDWGEVPEWRQLLLRAFVYRTATQGRFETLGAARSGGVAYARSCRPVLHAVLSREG